MRKAAERSGSGRSGNRVFLLLCPGVPWRLHIWLQCLHTAQQLCRDRVVVSLLSEFSSIRTEDYSPELLSTGVPLMFSMLETSKVQLKHPVLSVLKL